MFCPVSISLTMSAFCIYYAVLNTVMLLVIVQSLLFIAEQ